MGPMSARHAADPRKFAASRACRAVMAGWSVAKRSNYSVTEGELGEPSDGCGMGVWAPRGSNARVWCTGVMRQYGDGRSVSLAVVRPPWGRRWMGLPSAGSLLSPAVIEKFDRFAAARLSEASWGGGAVAHRACGGSVACGDGICSVVRPPWGRRWMGLLSAGSLRSPAVIEKFDRFAAARLSEASCGGGAVAHRACGGSVACGGWFFNTENRLFSRACSLACIYAKIRNA